MKYLLSLFLLLAIKSQAQVIDYNSMDFKSCHNIYQRTYGSAPATQTCETLIREGKGNYFSETNFLKCHELIYRQDSSANAANKCLIYGQADELGIFKKKSFGVCHNLVYRTMGSADAVYTCLQYERNSILSIFDNDNFLTCHSFRYRSMSSYEAVQSCIEQFKGEAVGSGPKVLSLQEVSDNIQLPENAQIILRSEIEVLGNQACAAPLNGERDVKCWVCRAKKSRNDVLYQLEKSEETGVPQKILPILEAKLSPDGKAIQFNVQNDQSDSDNLSSILCNSKKVFQIKNRDELKPILEKNGLGLVIPSAKVAK